MIDVLILTPYMKTQNTRAFISPIIKNYKRLKADCVNVRLSSEFNTEYLQSDVIIILSRFVAQNNLWENKEKIWQLLSNCKKNSDRLIWADITDSSGTTQFEVLPYVDSYLKGAVLANKSLYFNEMYGSRIFTDYYHQHYGVNDPNEGEPHLNHIPNPEDLDKIILGWNSSFYNYNYLGYFYNLIDSRMNLPAIQIKKTVSPIRERKIPFNIRFGANYSRNTVAFQRRRILQILNNNTETKRISRTKYYKELKDSRIVISPFGWGEICYRDFETFNYGAALLKPDCRHLVTWPDLYKPDETYIPFKWDLTDLREKLDSVIGHSKETVRLAKNGQDNYHKYLFSEKGQKLFVERFLSIIKNNNKNDYQ